MAAGCTPQSIQSSRGRVFDREDGRLGNGRGKNLALRGALIAIIPAGIENVTQIGAQKGLQELGACIEMMVKFRLLIVEAATHFRILGSLARKHEDNGRILTARASRAYLAGGKRRHGLVAVTAQQCRTIGEVATSNLQGMGDIGQTLLRMLADMFGQVAAYLFER